MIKKVILKAHRITVKVGSGVIANISGLNQEAVENIVKDLVYLKNLKKEVILVSSGAIAAGAGKLNLKGNLSQIPKKQAVAAVGQGLLMYIYDKFFDKFNILVGQILLTKDDLNNKKRYLNARNTIFTLLKFGAIPIINENDSVAIDELKFGDNDILSALVALLTDSDILLILSDIDGLYTKDPKTDKNAKLVEIVDEINEEIENMISDTVSLVGTGGMKSKISAAKIATEAGVYVLIINGKKKNPIRSILEEKGKGTLFLAKKKGSKKKHWIAHVLTPKGKVFIDDGAKKAILNHGKSLLPSGIISVEGNFEAGDVISCFDKDKVEIARGLSNYSAIEVEQIKGLKSSEIKKILGYNLYDEVIHRDNLVILR